MRGTSLAGATVIGLLTIFGSVGLAACGGENSSRSGGPQTLAVLNARWPYAPAVFAVGDGKLAWITSSEVRVLDLSTQRRSAVGAGDGADATDVAIVDGAIVWLTFAGGNTETAENIYVASDGRTRRLASFNDTGCEENDAACGASLSETDGHAYLEHASALSSVDASGLEPTPVPVGTTGTQVVGVSWPLVAVSEGGSLSSHEPRDINVYRLNDGRDAGTVWLAYGDTVVLSDSLLATVGTVASGGKDRFVVGRIYVLPSGRQVRAIRNEAVVAILGHRIVSLAPSPGRLLVRESNGRPRLVVTVPGRVLWSELEKSRLYWVEARTTQTGRQVDLLRALDLDALK